jgi:hypothetical protein
MTYHPLTNDDGCATIEERQARVADLIEKLTPCLDQMSDKQRGFVESMDGEMNPTVKQHLWLRDLWEKYQ